MKKCIWGTLFLFIIVSCEQPEDEVKVIDTDIEADTLYGKLQFPVFAQLAADIIEIDSLLLVSTPFEGGFFDLYTKTDGEIVYTFDRRGKGPDEYLQPYFYKGFDDRISLWDSSPKVFAEFETIVESDKKINFSTVSSIQNSEFGTHLFRLNDELLVSGVMLYEGMFALFDNEGEQIGNNFGETPIRDAEGQNNRFQGTIAVTNSGDMFVFGPFSLGYLCAYEIDENYQPTLKWEFYFDEPAYTLEEDRFSWDEDNHLQGVKDIRIVNDKIFVLYSGRSISLPRNEPEGAFSDYLYVLNFEGKIMEKYRLEPDVLKLAVSERDSAIYGITIDEDWYVVKYDFDSI